MWSSCPVPFLGLVFCTVYIFTVEGYMYCQHGTIANRCETHSGCDPDNMCHTCECYQDAWDCSYGGYGSCHKGPDSYYEYGTIGESKYYLSMQQKRFEDAKEACKGHEGHLAIIETDDEKNALQSLIDAAPKWAHPRDIFLGASTDDKKTWFWLNGANLDLNTRLSSSNIWWNFRNYYGEGPHCLELSGDKWDKTRCAYMNYYICEVPKAVVMPTPPGLAGPKEIGSFGGSTYSMTSRAKPWEASRGECQANGGDLVVINSEDEWKFLEKAVKDQGESDDLFMGATAASGCDGPWQWIDGSALDKEEARGGWGMACLTGRACLAIQMWGGRDSNWKNAGCNYSSKAICEKSAASD